MYNYSTELVIWALRRYANEMVLKIDRLQKKRMVLDSEAADDKLRGLRVSVAFKTQIAGLTIDIEKYSNALKEALNEANELYIKWGVNDESVLCRNVMMEVFEIGGCQRVIKYAHLLGWDVATVREYVAKNKGRIQVYDVALRDFVIAIVGEVGMLSSRKMLFATHGGKHLPFDYHAVRLDYLHEKNVNGKQSTSDYIPF